MFNSNKLNISTTYVVCPKHGEHQHTINSSIPGHSGWWCLLCWLESLGPSLEGGFGKPRAADEGASDE